MSSTTRRAVLTGVFGAAIVSFGGAVSAQSVVKIGAVAPKSGPLAAAGVRDGDIILTANGTTLQWRDQLLKVVRSLKPADDLELTVSDPSGRSRRQVKVQLGSLARPDRATKEQP